MDKRIVGVVVVASSALGAQAQIQFYTQPADFLQAVQAAGKDLKGVEDFEESTVMQGQKIAFPNSLQNGVPRPTFDNGINATNLVIQTNITQGPFAPAPNPSTFSQALWVNGAGFIGSNSIKVGTDEFLNNTFSSLDLIFTTHDKTAVSLDVSTYMGFAQGHQGFDIGIFDASDNLLGTFSIIGPTPPEPAKNFFGVWSSVPIGRINIWGIFAVPQPFAIDNIEMWVPAPGAAGLLGLAGLMAARRRR